LTQGAYAETVLSVSVDICRNDSVTARYIDLEDANPSRYISSGNYRLEVVDGSGAIAYKTDFNVAFVLLSTPPIAVECSTINMRIPFTDSMKRLRIYRNDTEIFSRTLSLCNKNGICDAGYETYLSCPSDCPLDRQDGICLGRGDGVCDPDCDPGIDPDCSGSKADILQYLPYLLVGLCVLGGLAYFYKRRQSARIEKERQDFIKWKEEHKE
jgi:hypothetical protein